MNTDKPETESLGQISYRAREKQCRVHTPRTTFQEWPDLDEWDKECEEAGALAVRDAVLREDINRPLLDRRDFHEAIAQRLLNNFVIDKIWHQIYADAPIKDMVANVIGNEMNHFPRSAASAHLPQPEKQEEPSEMCKAVGNLGEWITPANVASSCGARTQPDSGKELGTIYGDAFLERMAWCAEEDNWPDGTYTKMWEGFECREFGAQAVAAHVRATDTALIEQMKGAMEDAIVEVKRLALMLRDMEVSAKVQLDVVAAGEAVLAAVRERKQS